MEVVRDEDLKLGERPSKRLKGDKGRQGEKDEMKGRTKDAGYARDMAGAVEGQEAEDGDGAVSQAGPSKSLQEFMEVMKGVDPTAAVPEVAARKESKKGKERDVTPPPAQVADDDDDAAWLAKRKGNLGGLDEDGEQGSAVVVSLAY